MRKLTVRRAKGSFFSPSRVFLYLENHEQSDTTVSGIPCQYLGTLKRGSQTTVEIGDTACRLFATTSRINRDINSTCFQLPEGSDDIVLSGETEYDSAKNGNLFRFHSTLMPDFKIRRTHPAILSLLLCVLVFAVIGMIVRFVALGINREKPKDFTSHGMTVTLTDKFREDSVVEYTVCYRSKDVLVLGLRESFSSASGFEKLSLTEYVDLLLEANQMSRDKLQTSGSFENKPGFEYTYTDPETQDTYHYIVYTYKTGDAFWNVQFITRENTFSQYKDRIASWAASVKFDAA